jgi:hypothetical protein
MKRMLSKKSKLYHYENGERVAGANRNMWGDCSGLWEDCTGLYGACWKGLVGNCTDLKGDCSGLWGDCTGVVGDLDKCKIILEDRQAGINIRDLVRQ